MSNPYVLTIKRTREFHLIDSKGNKYVDFSLAESGAVLGHRYLKTHKMMKQAFDKGLEGNYHTHEKDRMITHMHRYLKGWQFHAMIHTHLSQNALLHHPVIKKLEIDTIEDLLLVHDPAHTEGTAVVYRPYSGIDRHTLRESRTRYLFVVMPIEWGCATVVILEKSSSVDIDVHNVYIEPSSVLLAGINYILPTIIAHTQEVRPFAVQAKNRTDVYVLDPFITSIPPQYKDACLDLPSEWRQQGIYIVLPQYSYEEYKILWQTFLSLGLYLPRATEHYIPRILAIPTYMTKHELFNWTQAIQTVA